MDLTKPNYQAWLINEKDYPKSGTIEEKIWFIVGYGILAPSTHNTQPWLFEVNDYRLFITPDSKLMLTGADPSGRNLQISLGCCVTNILIAAAYFGFRTKDKWAKDAITITFEKYQPNRSIKDLFDAMPQRYSDKMPYKNKPLKANHSDQLLLNLSDSGGSLILFSDKEVIDQIARKQAAATLGYKNNREFFEELSHWLQPSKTESEYGMPGFVVGLSNGQSKIFKPLIRKLKPTVKLLAKKDHTAVASSSAIGFISTQNDATQDWYNAGKKYERLALHATSLGLVMAPMAALIEDKEQRAQVSNTLKIDGNPQIFFRLGYSKHKPYHTPRRRVGHSAMETQRQLMKNLGIAVESNRIKIDSYDINYIVAGSGKPVLMLHGANIGWAQWFQNIVEISKYFKVYALDMPGAGSSTKVNFHETNFEKDYLRIVDKFIMKMNLNNVNIVGSSFGGWVALRLAIENKPYLNKIVLTNPLGFTTHMPLRFRPVSLRPFALFLSKTALKPVRKNKNLEKFMRDVFYDKNLPLSSLFVDYFYELSKTSHNILFISRLAHPTGMRKELFLGKDLSKISKPVFVIWGKEDPLMPFKTVEKNIHLIPGVKLETLEEVGHMPPVEVPTKFNKLTINFLKDK